MPMAARRATRPKDSAKRHVLLLGLEVSDDAQYAEYRAGMTPILERYGGKFGYDFVVSRVLKSETPEPINRVFTLLFPDAATADRFFSDTTYLAVRERFFEPSVSSVTSLATFE